MLSATPPPSCFSAIERSGGFACKLRVNGRQTWAPTKPTAAEAVAAAQAFVAEKKLYRVPAYQAKGGMTWSAFPPGAEDAEEEEEEEEEEEVDRLMFPHGGTATNGLCRCGACSFMTGLSAVSSAEEMHSPLTGGVSARTRRASLDLGQRRSSGQTRWC